jgi:hypothetical protein
MMMYFVIRDPKGYALATGEGVKDIEVLLFACVQVFSFTYM